VKRDPEHDPAQIRRLNDAFRHSLLGGQAFFTVGVSALGIAFSHRALAKVRTFDQFGTDNDPWGEHDFGSVDVDERKVFWKIDVYDKTYNAHLATLVVQTFRA